MCYQTICRDAERLVGHHDHPRITMDSIPLAAWMPSFDGDDDEGLARLMLDSANVLAAAGADFAICPDNSAHRAWDEVQAEQHPMAAHRQRGRRGGPAARIAPARPARDPLRDGRSFYRDTLASMGIETVVRTTTTSPPSTGSSSPSWSRHRHPCFAPGLRGRHRRRARLRCRGPGLHGDPAAGAGGGLDAADARLDSSAGRCRAARGPRVT